MWEYVGDTWRYVKDGVVVATDFLFMDDSRTITNPDSSFLEQAVAGASLLPQGKILKAGKVVNLGDDVVDAGKNVKDIKNVYTSIKNAPNYPDGFKGVQNGTKKVNVNNQDVINKLREVESGKWHKVYKDGYDLNGKKISIHYFQSSSGKVFDVKVKSGWSNK